MSRLFYHIAQDNLGNLLFDVSGTMRLAGTGTLATIYGDEALTVILPNPMTNHPSFGSFKCFLPSGDFDFYLSKAGYTFETLTGIQGYGTMAQQDADNITSNVEIDGLVGIQRAPESGYSLSTAFSAHVGQQLVVEGGTKLVGSVGIGRDFDVLYSLATLGHVAIGGQLAVVGGLTGAQAVFSAVTATPGAGDNVNAYHSAINSGNGRFALNMNGTAPSYLGGTLQVVGNMGVGVAPDTNGLHVAGNLYAATTMQTGGNVGIKAAADGTHALIVNGPLYAVTTMGIATVPTAGAKLAMKHAKGSSQHGIILQPSDADAGVVSEVLLLNLAGTSVGGISTTSTTTTYATSSDGRLKTAVDDLTGELAIIQALRPVSFRWLVDDSPGVGFLAQDVAAHVASAVVGEPDAVDEEGSIVPQMIDMSKLVPFLVGACKTLAAQVESLTARLDAAGA